MALSFYILGSSSISSRRINLMPVDGRKRGWLGGGGGSLLALQAARASMCLDFLFLR